MNKCEEFQYFTEQCMIHKSHCTARSNETKIESRESEKRPKNIAPTATTTPNITNY